MYRAKNRRDRNQDLVLQCNGFCNIFSTILHLHSGLGLASLQIAKSHFKTGIAKRTIP